MSSPRSHGRARPYSPSTIHHPLSNPSTVDHAVKAGQGCDLGLPTASPHRIGPNRTHPNLSELQRFFMPLRRRVQISTLKLQSAAFLCPPPSPAPNHSQAQTSSDKVRQGHFFPRSHLHSFKAQSSIFHGQAAPAFAASPNPDKFNHTADTSRAAPHHISALTHQKLSLLAVN